MRTCLKDTGDNFCSQSQVETSSLSLCLLNFFFDAQVAELLNNPPFQLLIMKMSYTASFTTSGLKFCSDCGHIENDKTNITENSRPS